MLRTRALSAIVLLVPFLALLWWGGLPWLVLVVVIAVLAMCELSAALQQRGYHPLSAPALAGVALLPIAAFADQSLALLAPVMSLAVILCLSVLLLRRTLDGALSDWALTVAAIAYVGLLAAHWVALRQLEQGLEWMLVALLCTWLCDSGAYLVGSALGRRPFAPAISPRKTWEGTLGGVGAATLTGLLAVPLVGVPIWLALVLGGLVAVAAVVGDLGESLIKRQLSIKDFSALIPGHGGVLDRVDSLLFTVPLVYYVAQLWSGI